LGAGLRRIGRFLALCFGCAGLAAQSGHPDFIRAEAPETLPPALVKGLQGIRAQALADHIAYLADPRREGRGLGSQGLDATARHLAAHVGKLGLSSLGKSYLQSVPLREIRGLGGTLRIEIPGMASGTWKHGVDCLLPELAPQLLSAPLVFVGHGIREPALGHDDFRELEVKGKIVLLVGGLPAGSPWQRPELQAKYRSLKPTERYAARVELLDRLGAKAVIALEEDCRASKHCSEAFFQAAPGVVLTDEPPLVRVSLEAARDLLKTLGADPRQPESLHPRALPGATARLLITGKVKPATSRNVIAILPGSDPTLKREAVILGAHMDHLGMRGGVLHPGADDNASGVAALMEIARAFARSPIRPRRTVIFAFWTGEEDGKFGSGHYVRHPLWPLARTSAYINLDMIGHPWRVEEIRKLAMESDPTGVEAFLAGLNPSDFAEPGFADWVPEFAPILARAGRGTGMALHLDRTDGCSGGSDYRDFARARIPWIRFFGNYFPEYHEAGDTPEKLDSFQVQKMARLAFATAWMLAER